jgi:serine/threonine protein kinase
LQLLAHELPKMIGGYTLMEKLGVGGTASVYLGRKRLHDGFEWVALKCLHPHLMEVDEFESMFLMEAELLSRLHHPNVCEILRYGTDDGVPFIATRYLKGTSFDRLQRKMMGRAIPLELMSWIVAEACAGLHHAHEARNDDGAQLGIVHRDVSPQNIFVTFDGTVQLIDFGVAHAAYSAGATTEVKGKDGYMSPEQLAGGRLDRRSDIFSLGIVLWEAMTGRRLFARENALATALAISEEPAPDPKEVNPRISDGLAGIALRALAIETNERFSSAKEMERALRVELADDLSGAIKLQTLMREVLDRDRDPTTDLDLEKSQHLALWMESDDDSADLTEIATPLSLESPHDTKPPPPAVSDVEDTISVKQRPASQRPARAVSVDTLPPKKPRQSWIIAVLAGVISVLVAIGFLLLSKG